MDLANPQSSGQSSSRKRRNTTVASSDLHGSQQRSIKRTKTTLKTYGGRKSKASYGEDDTAGELMDALQPRTSQSLRFSDHSGAASSAPPPGTDFIRHEPAVMFRDSGSTVADNESSAARLMEQALTTGHAAGMSSMKLAVEQNDPKSSSFPWTATEETPASQRKRALDLQLRNEATGAAADADIVHSAREKSADDPEVALAAVHDEPANNPPHPTATATEDHVVASVVLERRRSSPMVEIAIKPASPLVDTSDTPRIPKGRKRKVLDDFSTDPPDSDDIAVGLPKERYKPRPSRRRATQVAEETIDYSKIPEKAAKVNRNKTTVAASTAQKTPELHGGDEVSKAVQFDAPSLTERNHSRDASPSELMDVSEILALRKIPTQAASEPSEIAPATSNVKLLPEENHEVSPNKSKMVASLKGHNTSPIKHYSDDSEVVRPSIKRKPPAKASKRSKTTIFEDHVEFMGSQPKRATLSQQQAERKAALGTVENDAVRPSQRKRRRIIQDVEDFDGDVRAIDEAVALQAKLNEAAAAPEKAGVREADEEEEPLKKRAKGRTKSNKSTKIKSAERVLDDSDAESQVTSEVDEAPKKKVRGRPAKTEPAAVVEIVKETVSSTDIENVPEETTTVDMDDDPGEKTLNDEETRKSRTQAPTPSPEQLSKKPAAPVAKPPPRSSPTSHTPIKRSTAVPLRVGLSRSQRIPSLLQIKKQPTKAVPKKARASNTAAVEVEE